VERGATEAWAIDFPNHLRTATWWCPRQVLHDGRQPAQQPGFALLGLCAAGNIVGRPLFNYWSFVTPEDQYEKPGLANTAAWMGHVALHFLTETRWKRTLHVVR